MPFSWCKYTFKISMLVHVFYTDYDIWFSNWQYKGTFVIKIQHIRMKVSEKFTWDPEILAPNTCIKCTFRSDGSQLFWKQSVT